MQQYPKYKVTNSEELDVIEFVNAGKKGDIDKVILIQPTDVPFHFNLAFGDKIKRVKKNEVFFELDDTVNSENGDRDMVLATVAWAVYEYTSKSPERWIFFSGSNEIRTRLYRMAITKNYIELCKDFYIFGVVIENNELVKVPFDSNIQVYGFMVKRKN